MHPLPVFRCDLHLTMIAVGLGVGIGGGLAAQGTLEEAPYELPKYTVTAERELPPPESWHYARIPGFEVLSNTSEGGTRDLLNNFQRFAHAVDLVWPGLVPPGTAPAALIICGRGDQFGAFVPASARSTERAMTSLILRTREQAAIVLDRQTKVLNLATVEGVADAATAVVVDEEGIAAGTGADPGFVVDAYRQLYREYLRFLLTSREVPPPAWFAEGLAQLFMAMEVTDTSITLGKLDDPNAPSRQPEDRDFSATLAKRALLPMAELFAVTLDSPTALNPLGSTWAKQSYAFVHWGLYGDAGRHQKDFFTFLARLGRETLSEALFRECFQQSYEEMLFTLRRYLEFTRHKVAGIRAEKGQKISEPPPVGLREATEAEVGRLKGETLRLAGKRTAAHTALVTPYRRGQRDPALLAALGIDEANGGDPVKARQLLEAAAGAKVVRPRAYVELARLRLLEAHAQPEGTGGKMSARQTTFILEPLFVAHGQLPALPELYELIGEAWGQSELAPSAAQLAVLDEGVRLFPRNAILVYRDAALQAKIGRVREAESLIRLGLRVTTDEGLRAKFEALTVGLPAAPLKK